MRLSLAESSSAALVPPLSVPDDTLARRTVESAAPVWEGPPPGGQSAALGVPVRVSGQTLAVLEVRSPRAREQDPGWVATLGDVGSQLGLFLKRQRAEADLQRFARYDGLTGLPNRTFFLDTLERTLARARRRRSRLALIFLDLDGFKAVNDRFGHATGDAVLQIMAERLRAGTRTSDLVARIGGDEFTVLLQSLARADDAALVARALIDRLARPCTVEDQEIALGASAGIAVYPEDGTDADALLRNADLAMYRAKQEGRNTYRFFTAEMSERALERMLLLDGLRVALERDEFELVYLLVFRVAAGPPASRRCCGGGIRSSASSRRRRSLPRPRRAGSILPIGTRVLRMATRFVASLPTQDDPPHREPLDAAVPTAEPRRGSAPGPRAERPSRVAARARPDRADGDGGERRDGRARPRAAGDGRPARARRLRHRLLLIGRLRELGFSASRSTVRFVAGLPGHAEHAAQVLAILALARALGLEVVAEGVETEAQRDFLLAHGCDALQGYLLSQPLAAEDVAGFVAPR